MNRTPLITALVILLALLAGGAALQRYSRNEMTLPKDLKFSHKLHVGDQTIGCTDCHTSALATTNLTVRMLGSHDECGSCHGDQVAANCSFCHTDTAHIQPKPVSKRELVFSHALHTDSTRNIQCTTCHAGIDTLTTVQAAALPSMSLCMNCHEQRKASVLCATCHSDLTSLIPDNHLHTDFKSEHKQLVRAGTIEVTCAQCHQESFCQDCHTGIQLRAFAFRNGLMSDPAPRRMGSNSPAQLRMQASHDLNYRFTHAIDARSLRSDCATCHDRQQFCAECHESGTLNQTRVRPASHNQTAFTTLGRGSGGGLHAVMARRDLESCTACHDVHGADPVCSMCHNDNGSVR